MSFKVAYKSLLEPFRSRLMLAAVCAAGVSVASVALLGLSGWFLTAAAVAGVSGPVAVQAFNYLLPSAFIRFFAVARTALRYGERYLGHSAGLRAMARLRPALFARIVAAPAEAAMSLSRGDAASRFIHDVAALENALVLKSAPAGALGALFFAVVFCLWANPLTALILAVFVAAAVLAGSLIARFKAGEGGDQAALGAVKARFGEIMAVLPDIRAYDLREPLLEELRELETWLGRARAGSVDRDGLIQAALLVLTGLCLCAVALSSAHDRLADMALALLAASMGMESTGALIRAIGQKAVSDEAEMRVAQIHDLPQAKDLPAEAGFSYDGRSFHYDAALRLRIDGASGSGKTRLIEGLLRLRGEGSGGHPALSLAPQDAGLLTGTIRANLAMSSEAVVGEERVWQALEDACLSERIKALPRGLDTWVGEGGVTLSGGERKRLGLARAYLRPAGVLVLDEPTEGLDLATERQVIERLEARLARENQGLMLISHREAPHRLAQDVLRLGGL